MEFTETNEAAAAVADFSETVDSAVSDSTIEQTGEVATGMEQTSTDDGNGGFGGEAKLDPASPEAHRGEIVSVTRYEAKTGTTAIAITLKSNDTGLSGGPGFTMNLWGPSDVLDQNSPCWASGHFDASHLSDEAPAGKKQSPRQAYARNFFNTKKTGVVQQVLAAAAEQGRTGASLGLSSPTNPEEYVANLNAILSGTEVLIVRKPEKNDDPKFDGSLKVSAIYGASIFNDSRRLDGVTKNLRKMWE